jgi:hypothetical protein
MPVSRVEPARRRTWLAVVGRVVLVVLAACGLLIGAGAYIASRYSTTSVVAPEQADAEFAAARKQFAGEQPFFELRGVNGGLMPVVHRTPTSPKRELVALDVLSYDPRTHTLRRSRLPGWFLKWASARGAIRLANLEVFDDARDRITLDDLERRGPGLIVDIGSGDRTRVLMWTE